MHPLLENLLAVRQATGKSFLAQLREIAWLKRNAKLFGVSDYFDHRLYLDDGRSMEDKATVAGWRMESWIDDRLNPTRWRGITKDKLFTYAVLDSLRLPYPKVHALFELGGRRFRDATTLSDIESLATFVRSGMPTPCFVKPIFGAVGSGAMSVVAYDRPSDTLLLGDGRAIPFREFRAGLLGRQKGVVTHAGFLFQQMIAQHPTLEQVCGRGVSTARVIVLVTDEGPLIHRAILRIVTGTNMTDNFAKGASGNLLGAVDLNRGTLTRIVRAYGIDQQLVETHPDSGRRLAGLQLPDWGRARDLCLTAALGFPMLRLQHWDVAFSESGPCILELNTTGSIDMIQYASGTGLYDENVRELIDKRGARD